MSLLWGNKNGTLPLWSSSLKLISLVYSWEQDRQIIIDWPLINAWQVLLKSSMSSNV